MVKVMTETNTITVIGAGLAGSEAAWQIASRGCSVRLYEMRPQKQTVAHHTGGFAELVCSNSLRADQLASGPGLLKEELRRMGSLVMEAADHTRVPAGGAQAVDREAFSAWITEKIKAHPNIEVICEEVEALPEDGVVVCASGPLTSDALFSSIKALTGADTLSAVTIGAAASEEYRVFYDTLMGAEWIPTKDFEKEIFFEGCMPVETMAKRGYQTLLFGPMKPVGLRDPRTGETPFAVVQLRREDEEGRLLNMVGFQTRTKWGDQKKVIQTIPALANAEIVRYGVMHRNTFLNGPMVLRDTCQMKAKENIFFAGQMTGVEGYIESTASGLVAGINAARLARGEAPLVFPRTTAIGALMNHVGNSPTDHFQPMNINFGLLPSPERRLRSKKERNAYYAERALGDLAEWMEENHVR